MGRRRGDQRRLFYEFDLDDRIPRTYLCGASMSS